MKTIEEIINNEEQQVNESLLYDEMIQKLQEAKENNVPIDEGILGAVTGGLLGTTVGPKLMQAVCKALGVDVKGSFGSLLTSKLVMGAVGTSMGWRL
jgi:predicted phage tail protein